MKPLFLIFNLLCSADAASTHIAIHQSRIGNDYKLVEGNFLFHTQNPYIIDSEVAGECYFVDKKVKERLGQSEEKNIMGLTNEEASKRIVHDRMEVKIMLFTGIFVRGFIVYSNIHQMRK